eukprot:NODE_49_length_2764_cov_84.963974_g30_i0.p2 GENE.NODE_49_length_2764_cov_84.963974_g30_i0~~NODE_49_length_2764_cov_84.963974_g30_i0.p2  ORF type:complete len:222 (+),score=13.51 NODE_49_length_2764_cov_84.963974_g30_i0:177-842(+)
MADPALGSLIQRHVPPHLHQLCYNLFGQGVTTVEQFKSNWTTMQGYLQQPTCDRSYHQLLGPLQAMHHSVAAGGQVTWTPPPPQQHHSMPTPAYTGAPAGGADLRHSAPPQSYQPAVPQQPMYQHPSQLPPGVPPHQQYTQPVTRPQPVQAPAQPMVPPPGGPEQRACRRANCPYKGIITDPKPNARLCPSCCSELHGQQYSHTRGKQAQRRVTHTGNERQ